MNEFKEFIETLSNRTRDDYEDSLKDPATIRTSLKLLDDMPAARELVFEYFAMLAEISVQNYVNETATAKQFQQGRNTADKQNPNEQKPHEDTFFDPVLIALNNILTRRPQAWRPVIASWSIKLVSTLSQKYSQRHMSIMATCTYWMNSTTMRGCLTLLSSCLRSMPSAETEVCVKEMLETFHSNPTSFHWVVARLGGCFPQKIITHLLQCGLTRFIQNNRCHLDSEIGILEQLSLAHEQVEKSALRDLIEIGLAPKKTEDTQIVPYLLAITCYSEIMLTLLIDVFLEFYNEKLYDKIESEGPVWLRFMSFMDSPTTLNNLILRSKKHGTDILLSIALTVEKYSWSKLFLESTLQELESRMIKGTNCALLEDLTRRHTIEKLWENCLNEDPIAQQTAVRLLLAVSTHRSYIYYQTISALFQKNYRIKSEGFGAIICLLGGQAGVPNFPKITPGFKMLLSNVLTQERFKHRQLLEGGESEITAAYNTICNLITLKRMQKSNACFTISARCLEEAISESLIDIIQLLEISVDNLLSIIRKERAALQLRRDTDSQKNIDNKSNSANLTDLDIKKNITGKWQESNHEFHRLRLAHEIVIFLNSLEMESKANITPTTHVLKLAIASVKYFFVVLAEPNIVRRAAALNQISTLLQRQCTIWKLSRTTCLKELIEGALYSYRFMFGCAENIKMDKFEIPLHEMVITQNENCTLGSNSNRAILHSGIIGRGLRFKNGPVKHNFYAEEQKSLIRILNVCCRDLIAKQKDASRTTELKPNDEGYTTVALILVDLVSPNVMHNSLEFPEEDLNKVTIERDVHIRRQFNESPILWVLLGFLATNRPALCHASVLLRALLANCIHQWRARNVNRFDVVNPHDELVHCTKKVLQLLSMGQLLPPPLSKAHLIIDQFDSLEITSILKECIWNYLKDEIKFVELTNGLPQRVVRHRDIPPQYINTLRHLLQQKMNKLGSHLHQMFVLPDLIAQQNADTLNSSNLASAMHID